MSVKYKDLFDVLSKQYKFAVITKAGSVIAATARCVIVDGRWVYAPGIHGDVWYEVEKYLDITDLPTDWEKSLIVRPKEWKMPDESMVGAECWARYGSDGKWFRCHCAGSGHVFSCGRSAWTGRDDATLQPGCTMWPNYIVLADGPNPPPADYVPRKEGE